MGGGFYAAGASTVKEASPVVLSVVKDLMAIASGVAFEPA
jgi:hypothetical protein